MQLIPRLAPSYGEPDCRQAGLTTMPIGRQAMPSRLDSAKRAGRQASVKLQSPFHLVVTLRVSTMLGFVHYYIRSRTFALSFLKQLSLIMDSRQPIVFAPFLHG
jgi:hypothetical protein